MQMSRSVLIVGGSGFVGSHLALHFRENYKVFTTHYHHHEPMRGVTSIPMALHKADWIKEVVLATRPRFIIYAARPRKNESDPKEMDLIYSSAPLTLVQASAILGSKFIYLSNAFVFNGDEGDYKETDAALPALPEGRSRASGENAVRARATQHAIIRSSPVYGLGPVRNPSMCDLWIKKLIQGETLELDDQQVHTFAPVEGLADAVEKACSSNVENRVFHYAGREPLTEFALGKRLAERLGLPTQKIHPRASSSKKNYSLNCSESAFCLQTEPLLLEQGLDLLEKQLLASRL